MPIQYVDNHPTIAYDGVNDKLKVNDATLEQKIDDLNTKIDAIISGDSPATTLTELSGSNLTEQKTNADAVENVITFSANIVAIEIYHNEATWQDFIVNGITIKIPSGGYRTPIAGTPAKTVTIPAGINCIVGRLV